ncbi:integrin alpha-6-like isoform X2 [Hippocampus comes]|uniref:integrin alpha-6-like isoform X2 n=1 Tax=Hippocampus comes TaxID=109280 RepID=UPI00094E9139|nr:PREDICTED: integrin alpha-6-like isoform X2 [Hippocampus comes]
METFWYMVCLWSVNVAAFNLDIQRVMERTGPQGSLFGFSVAFHQQLSPAKRNLLLVGSPKSKHPHLGNVTGVVYQCDLSVSSEHCQPIDFNHEEFLESNGINGQWMGVRVTSQGPGQNVMTCAHRYQQWSPSPGLYTPRLVTGQCYILGDGLQVGTEERTWRRVVCDAEHLNRRQKDQEWFAYCQQGHGASFAKDNRSVVFGAPGAYQWKGIVRTELLDNLDIFGELPRETGNIDQFNSKLIPLQRNSYLGFSTDSGMTLLQGGELTIVSGAPRGGYSGQVAFLKADPLAERSLSVELVLSGPGLASSFGYDLAVVDLNNDGWEDLAVGAPEFFLKDGVIGGAVYIYINNKGKNWQEVNPIQILGHKDSMFGLAVENIGDVNQDGYRDIAVGAPYDGSGRVYLYCGSSSGINRKAAQVLSPGSKKITLFGYSLAGNLDIDDNQYPDLAVGSLSDMVFVYRARPVVSVSSTLTITPNEIDVSKQQCNQLTCYFAVKACFTYSAHPASFNSKLTIRFSIEADAARRKSRLPPRVDFLGSSQGTLELPGQGSKICVKTKLRLLRDTRDRLHSIPVSVTLSLLSSSPKARTNVELPDVTPVLNLYQEKSPVSEITFINEGCGSDNVCHSNLELQYKFCARKTQKHQDIFQSLVREDGVAVITPSGEDVALEIIVSNSDGEDAHQSHVVVNLPDLLRYSSVVYASTSVTCSGNDKGTVIDCELGNPLQRDAQVKFYVMLTTTGISLSTKSVNITLQLQTTSVQTLEAVEATAKVVFELGLQVYGLAKPSQVSLTKGLMGKKVVKTIDDIGTPIQFEFKITNQGRSLKSFANASLDIHWPKENTDGTRLLYLTQVTSAGVHFVSCTPADQINPLKLRGQHGASRERREAEHEGQYDALSTAGFLFLPSKRKYKTLSCSDGLKCEELRCPVVGLDSTALIVLHARLWNSTLTADYSSLNYLDIVVDAALTLTNSPENIGLPEKKLRTKVKVTVFLEREDEYFTKVAWWIIFLTVVAGLLLLAVLCFFLWKRGCIKCSMCNHKSSHMKLEKLKA